MLKREFRMPAILLVICLLLACAPVSVSTPVAPPTFDPLSLNTIIAQTAGAAATQTYVLQPTLTSVPTLTKTPTDIPTSTPTFLFVLSTPTVPSLTPTLEISSDPYACRLASQDPKDNSVVAKGADFTTLWKVINVGANFWDSNSLDYHYFNGEKLHKASVYDLQNSVPTGGQIDLIVKMKAPKEAGTYTTTWALRVGKQDFCKLHLTIKIN
jgi:hypothetical protein